MLTQAKLDNINNALIIGMALDDAYIYAGLSEAEILEVSQDNELQAAFHQITKRFEYSLLNDMVGIAKKQARMGRESATTWMLEKMFPRYSGKPQADNGEVHLHFHDVDPASLDTVEIFHPKEVNDTTAGNTNTDDKKDGN